MILEDLRAIDANAPIEADVCIVGSGPAGCTIAEELRNSGLRLLMLESGGLVGEPESEALNEIESVGTPLLNGRDRRLGGTSSVWYGRCIPLDDLDYEAREWVPLSGWPFGSETVAPHLDRALEHVGAGRFRSDGSNPTPGERPERPAVNGAELHDVRWEDTPPVDFGRRILASEDPDLRVLLHATVTHLNTDPTGSRVESVEIASSPERRATVTAKAVVLCAGGVENARIMLYSNRISPNGVGNENDVVGRYFMDHPRDDSLTVRFDPRDAERIRGLFGPHRLPGARRHEVAHGLGLAPERQRRDGLLNCAALPYEVPAEDDPLLAAKRLVAGPRTSAARDARLAVSRPGVLARGVRARLTRQRVTHEIDRIGFLISSEQVPDPDSRISLSERRDRFGLPISRIDWRIGQQEKASQAALAKAIASEFARLGLPRANLAEWVREDRYDEAPLIDGCHPIGTTRMAADPRHGVVDSDCQVHGIRGLYVAGSSTFPTGGHANPTLMIVALAVRLARHLREHLSASPNLRPAEDGSASQQEDRSELEARANSQEGPSLAPGTKVAVTGATGFIGGRLVERLVDQGADVTCLVRPSSDRSRLHPSAVALELELSDADAVRAALDGVDVVFHCAYDWGDEAWNHVALRALIDACRANRWKRLVHLSSFVVYEPPHDGELTEESPDTRAEEGYARTKLELEAELMRAVREEALPATVLQPTIVYGPFSRPWTDAPADMLRFGTVVLTDGGAGVCNAVYVDDVVSAMILAATDPDAVGERFLISGPRPITWSRFYAEIAKAVGASGPRYQPPESPLRRRARKLSALARNPARVVSRAAQTGPGQKAAAVCLRVLPPRTRERVRGRLLAPPTRQPGAVHAPDVHSGVTVSSDKARRTIGYEPRFDFADGMVPTSRYLREYVEQDPAV